jgi:hypothetical protein
VSGGSEFWNQSLGILSPIQELLGTWWAITNKEWRENPVDDRHAMYCSAFARLQAIIIPSKPPAVPEDARGLTIAGI